MGDSSLASIETMASSSSAAPSATSPKQANSRAVGDARLVGMHPMSEAGLVVTSEIRRGRQPVEIIDVESFGLDRGQQAPCVAPSVVVARQPSVLDGSHHVAQSRPFDSGDQAK